MRAFSKSAAAPMPSAAPTKAAKGDHPYGIPVPGKPHVVEARQDHQVAGACEPERDDACHVRDEDLPLSGDDRVGRVPRPGDAASWVGEFRNRGGGLAPGRFASEHREALSLLGRPFPGQPRRAYLRGR